MRTWFVMLVAGLFLAFRLPAQKAARPLVLPDPIEEQMLREQKHFAECLAFVYDPALWVSYSGTLYFLPRNDAQRQQLAAMKTARGQYTVLTNRLARYTFVTRLFDQAGLGYEWRRKMLLPYSETNQNLTPTLDRSFREVGPYRVVQAFPGNDAIIEAGSFRAYILNFGRGGADAAHTNLLLVLEGRKSFRLAYNQPIETVDAYTDVALSPEETEKLGFTAAAFRKTAAWLTDELGRLDARQDFAGLLSRASDSTPYFEYLVGKAYLEGKGIDPDAQLAREWMERAARNGSGDAQAYLASIRTNVPASDLKSSSLPK